MSNTKSRIITRLYAALVDVQRLVDENEDESIEDELYQAMKLLHTALSTLEEDGN